MLILNSTLCSYRHARTHTHTHTHTHMERNNSVYPAHNFQVMQRATGGGEEREDLRNVELNSELTQPVTREDCTTGVNSSEKKDNVSKIAVALLYPFLSHCQFSHINNLFQFEVPPCQFVSSPARAWRLTSAVPYLSTRVSYDEHIGLFIYIPFRSFVLSPYQTSNELLSSKFPPPPQISYFSVDSFSTLISVSYGLTTCTLVLYFRALLKLNSELTFYECSLFSFGNFPGVWSIKADVSELNVGSIVLGHQE